MSYLDDDLNTAGFLQPPADLTIQFAADCKAASAILARNVQGIVGYAITVTGPDGVPGTPTPPVTTSTTTTLSFATPTDGVYLLQPTDSDPTTPPYPVIPVLVNCRLLTCYRRLNKKAATGGQVKRGKAPNDTLLELDAVLAMMYACYNQGDQVSVRALITQATTLCTDCGCGCSN